MLFISLLLCVPINSQASVRTNDDFILSAEMPAHLKSLSEIYYFRLAPGGHEPDIVTDEAFLPNACFIAVNDENIRFEVGDGYNG
ncbi:MAG: hypothetical protein HDR27_06230 [Lachnospiraceae bacterium]|nr:hypothetical protein [Lachnospiraceae bacterium]